MSAGAVVLEVEGAVKHFGATAALEGLSLTVRAGEWLALLGPNGAGKTTLMRAIAGRTALDRGTVELLGVKIRPGDPDATRPLGLVPQEIALYPRLSARENLRLFGRLHGLAGGELRRQVCWALDWTRLAPRADELAERLSGGMKRRLNIACGVLHRPRVVLLDEPTAGVDPEGRRHVWRMLESLCAEGTALVQSSHQLEEIEGLCDRVVIIDHGRVLADGTVEEVVAAVLGDRRTCRIDLDRPAEHLVLDNGFRVDGSSIRGTFHDLGELLQLLERVRQAGCTVCDLRVATPGLEAAFARLTGRRSRE